MSRSGSFVEVAVALPVAGTFHYAVPAALTAAARPGARVLVPFGRRGVTGVVVRCGGPPPAGVEVRAVREILDETPALEPELIDLCLWVADYYQAPPGEVLRAALPAGTAVATRGRPRLTESGRAALAGRAEAALSANVRRRLGAAAAGRPPTGTALADLAGRGLVEVVDDRRAARVRPRRLATVTLARPPADAERAALARAPRRAAVLAELERAGGTLDLADLGRRVPGATGAVRALAQTGLVARGERELRREPSWWEPASAAAPAPEPNAAQARALDEIGAAVAAGEFRPFLLHGVTSSGKTEVYLRAIAAVLARGRGAVVLVPEIALTPQLAARFRGRFGDQVAVLHSGLSPGERFDQWRRLRAGQARIALGARSAVFAPVRDLGMIVVDEEHDPSFKQEEGVRYHARDVALVRAQRGAAVAVLGSATPALETYEHAREGRYRLLELPERATPRPLPTVDVVDLRVCRPDGESLLSAPLRVALEATLAAGEQAILFLNRRGFATFVVCTGCGHAFRCPQCSVSLTYHRSGERLRCHYCNHSEPVPITCPSCEAAGTIRRFGLGTERIEQALAARYPGARIGRLDRDTAAGDGLRTVIERVAAREIDVLVGTQMVTKGHDFPGVTLVGVLLADSGLAFPDFRAGERTFQLLTQVAGRAGRGDRPGRVIIQSYDPGHPAVAHARAHDYHAFFAEESALRKELLYPPHGRLVAIRLDGSDDHEVRGAADALAARARALGAGGATQGVSVLGPAEAPLRRLKGRSRWHLWAKAADRGVLRTFVRRLADDLALPPSVRMTVDVDPVSAL